MVLVRMRDDNPHEVLLDALDEAQVRQDQIDARRLLPGECHAEIDHQPFAPVRRPETVKRAIHADLAEAAERREDQFLILRHSIDAFCGGRSATIGSRDPAPSSFGPAITLAAPARSSARNTSPASTASRPHAWRKRRRPRSSSVSKTPSRK